MDSLAASTADLLWSLWTELGVAGVIRRHAHVAVDPEPLLAVTPALAAAEPRLLEQVVCWSVAHAEHVNAGRLATLVRGLPEPARAAFEGFGAAVNAAAGTRWPAGAGPGPVARLREVALPLERPALVRLRARALCGVGTRADVLVDLLAAPRDWRTAAMLAEQGHSKRNVARVLAELEAAGLVTGQAAGNARRFRPAQPEALRAALQLGRCAHPDWTRLGTLLLRLAELAALEPMPAPARRVDAHARRGALQTDADALDLPPPPQTRGQADAWERLMGWASDTAAQLATGRAAAFDPPALRVAEPAALGFEG